MIGKRFVKEKQNIERECILLYDVINNLLISIQSYIQWYVMTCYIQFQYSVQYNNLLVSIQWNFKLTSKSIIVVFFLLFSQLSP